MAPILGYWKIRGLAQAIRNLLTYAGEEFEDKMYQTGPAPDFDRSSWLDDKFKLNLDFPNLPYYIDGDVKLTQSTAILRYVARKHNLLGKTEEERIRADMLLNQIEDYRRNFVMLCYDPNFEDLKAGYLKELPNVLKALSDFLGKNKFFAGENVTMVDFLAYEFLHQQVTLKPDSLDEFSNLKEFKESFESLPTLSDYLKNSPASKLPLNSAMAKFGNE